MSLLQELTFAFTKFLDPTGRANRTEFWSFFFTIILGGGTCALLLSLFIPMTIDNPSILIIIIMLLLSLFVYFFLFFSISVRRLHDTNRSAWWLCFHLIPIFGQITLFLCFISKSSPQKNSYGSYIK